MNWIPTKERLPEKHTRVIVTEYDKENDDYYVYVSNLYMSIYYEQMRWMDDDGYSLQKAMRFLLTCDVISMSGYLLDFR